jgi:hypothetical protein
MQAHALKGMPLVHANRFGHLRVETRPVSHLAAEKGIFSVLAIQKINKNTFFW